MLYYSKRGEHISEKLRPAGQPSVSRELVHKKEDDLWGHPLLKYKYPNERLSVAEIPLGIVAVEVILSKGWGAVGN